MELTYNGRANSLVLFYNKIGGSNVAIAANVVLARFAGAGIVFDPDGMDVDIAKPSSKNTTATVTSYIVRKVLPGETADVTFNGQGYIRVNDGTPSVANLVSSTYNPNNEFLLYIDVALTLNSGSSYMFRQIGIVDSAIVSPLTALIYQNVPPQSVVASPLHIGMMLAF